MLAPQVVSALKAGLALAGLLFFLADRWAARTGRLAWLTAHRDDLLMGLGLLALLGWWDFQSPTSSRFHRHELFHYYLGAKYQAELGYTRLYKCAALAEAEQGARATVEARWIRNLETNVIEPGRVVLANAGECTTRFSPARWQAFSLDVEWLRAQLPADRWRALFIDHGYNATPVWTMAGTALANLCPAGSDRIRWLARIDLGLLLALWGLAWWAFGWRAACVAALWWGTNHPARSHWTAGAFLRADWLLLLVASVAFLRKGWSLLGGMALGYAILLRIFPGFLAVGYVFAEGARMWQAHTWRPSPGFLRFAGGMALSLILLVPLASWVNSGRMLDLDAWRDFTQNSRKHLGQTSTNRMGLKVVVAFDPETRVSQTKDLWLDGPWDAWYAARARTFEQRKPLFWLVVAAFLVLLARAAAGREPWVALILGAGLLPIAFELSGYYYAFFLIFGLLWTRHALVGPLLLAVSALGWMGVATLDQTDEVFLVHSLLVVSFTLVTTAVLARRSVEHSTSALTSTTR